MPQAKGSKSKIIYNTETTFKTTRSPADAHVLPFVSESLRQTRNLIDSKTLTGVRDTAKPARGNKEVAGDITMELSPYIGKLFYNALGTFTSSGANPYSHTFKINDLPAGITIEKQFTDLTVPKYFVYNGCKVNSMKINIKPEGFIDTVFSFMGAVETVTAASFDSDATNYSSQAVGQQFDGFQATIMEGGVSLGICSEIEFTLENNLDGSIFVIDGTGTRYAMPEGMAKVSGNVKVLFEDTTMYDKAINNAETSLVITLTHGTGAGSANNEKIDFYIDELLFEPSAPVVSGPNGIMVDMNFTGYYNDGNRASSLAVILWNTQTAANISQ